MAGLLSFGLVELLGLLVEFVQVELSDDVLLVANDRQVFTSPVLSLLPLPDCSLRRSASETIGRRPGPQSGKGLGWIWCDHTVRWI